MLRFLYKSVLISAAMNADVSEVHLRPKNCKNKENLQCKRKMHGYKDWSGRPAAIIDCKPPDTECPHRT